MSSLFATSCLVIDLVVFLLGLAIRQGLLEAEAAVKVKSKEVPGSSERLKTRASSSTWSGLRRGDGEERQRIFQTKTDHGLRLLAVRKWKDILSRTYVVILWRHRSHFRTSDSERAGRLFHHG